MILKKPLALVENKAVTTNVNTAISIFFQSPPATNPALLTALAAKPNPITAIIGPTTIGGNNLSIQSFPITLTINATTT